MEKPGSLPMYRLQVTKWILEMPKLHMPAILLY
jgi:hypothetical protein